MTRATRPRRPRRRTRGRADAGMSSVAVLLAFIMLSALVMVTATYAAQATRPAGRQTDWVRAGAAAESGVADYLGRLRDDPAYWATVDCDNAALAGQDPAVVDHACPWDADAVGWAAIEPDEDPDDAPAFHYEVTAAPVEAQPEWASTVTVTVTGRSGEVRRTLEVQFARASSADYALHQDYALTEATAWSESVGGAAAAGLAAECGAAGPLPTARDVLRDPACANAAVLGTATVVTGDVFSNDRLAVQPGAQVDGRVSTAHPDCGDASDDAATWSACLDVDGGAVVDVADVLDGHAPAAASSLTLPTSVAGYADLPGCHYYGETRVVGHGGTMTVHAPSTLEAANAAGLPTAVAAPGAPTPDCGDADLLALGTAQTVPVPDGVGIYVHTLGGASEPVSAGRLGASVAAGSLPVGTWTSATPADGDVADLEVEQVRTHRWTGRGTLYLEGWFSPGVAAGGPAEESGRAGVTFVAEESVVVTGDVLSSGSDPGDPCAGPGLTCQLGIVAGRSVEVLNPVVTEVSAVTLDPGGPDERVGWDLDVVLGVDGASRAVAATGTPGVDGWPDGGWPRRYVDTARGAAHPAQGVQIQASVQVLGGTLLVQNHWATDGVVAGVPSLEVVVTGSLAVRFAGLQDHGAWSPQVVYDPALRTGAPPYLSRFTESTPWTARHVTEVAAG